MSVIVDILEECVFELGIEISVADATNLIRLAEEKFISYNKQSTQVLCGCGDHIDLLGNRDYTYTDGGYYCVDCMRP